ncbi:MAG: carotenoid biosynthesis protein [Cytophagales bacterium]|nr:carotenoid biosynthesis protein [Cytophagales bacterium]MDW8385019.1 carotenoid biosynthesis protein [Flammeovirgaceae bacterium]
MILRKKIAILILVAFYFFGWLGTRSELMQFYLREFTSFNHFMELTPLTLGMSAFLLFSFHESWTLSNIVFFVACVVITFFIESIGVHTGVIFGPYRYGDVLGWKIWQTPVIIGVNWLILVYCTCHVAVRLVQNSTWHPFVAALFMVALDFFIEPVAIRFNMWEWEGGTVPLQNYLAWYCIAWIACWFALKSNVTRVQNSMAYYVLGLQFMFFLFV